MSLVLRKLNDPRMTPFHYLVLRDLYLETAEWTSHSSGELTDAQVLEGMTSPNSVWRAAFEDENLVGFIGAININWIDKTCEP